MSELDERELLRLAELAEAGIAAASLVHEVRQPLFALRAMAQLGQQSAEGVRMDEVLALVDHLESLLAAWSDVGRREEARIYDVREVVAGVVRMLEGRRRQVAAQIAVVDGPSVWAHGPPFVARQVALNLLLNALDAVAPGPERQVRVEIRMTTNRATLVVDDTGPGVSDSVADRMFEPFVTTKPADRGTGLGLYVARRLCEEQGGELRHERLASGTRMVAQFSTGPMKNA
ncbi:MAG: HAMP domain-containing histidine kinase [Alphaproteobacteria bacterium]|nr:HAMP domain-containing histidine kinase [Alphaproteobacteria bacterium]